MIDLNTLAKCCYDIAEKRRENGAFGKKCNDAPTLLKHCATEVVECMESYVDWQYCKNSAVEFENNSRRDFVSELADIITCCLIIAGIENIDIEKALRECCEKNRARAEGRGDKK